MTKTFSSNKPKPGRYDDSVQLMAWGLTGLVIALAVAAWGGTLVWRLHPITTYQLFPIFGLIAFSTMWSQYAVAALSRLFRWSGGLTRYYQATGFIVLAAILLHPGLLIWQLWRDGFGLPPDSYLQHYVAPSLRWVALIGTACLFIFLVYELRYKFGNRPWWRWMDYLVDIAMLAIFYHGLRLGTQTSSGWFHAVWTFYGVTLIGLLVYKYVGLYKQRRVRLATGV